MISIFRKLWDSCKNRKKQVISAFIFSCIKSALGITQLLAIITTINVLLGITTAKTGVITVAILTVICVLGNYICSFSEQINVMKTGFYMVADKRVNIGNKLRRLPLGFFNNSSRTQTIATLTTTLSNMETASIMVLIGIVSGLLNTIAIFVFMMFYDYRLGLIAGMGMVVYLFVVSLQMIQSRKNAPILQKAQDELSEDTLAFLQGIKVIKSYSFENGDAKLKQSIDNSAKANINLTNASMPGFFSASIVIAVFESILLLVTLVMFFSFHSIDLVKTIILVIFSFMVFASLNQAGSMLSMIGLLDAGLSEVEKIENYSELTIKQPTQKAQSDEIKLEHVSFAYENKTILQDVNFTVKPNSFTALVGPSGSGKTTICQLIPRFHDVLSGSITIGGVNVKNMEYCDICAKVSMVFQRVYLFSDTIVNNVRFGNPNATMEQVIDACKKAKCHDFISALPNGYDTIITEGGASLSGGERQRISIARAIIKDAPIILLDEATASVDPENEYEIQQALKQLTKNKTIIMIAHKMSTIKNADQILVLDKGRIVQQGKHNDLITQQGMYRDFVSAREQASTWTL